MGGQTRFYNTGGRKPPYFPFCKEIYRMAKANFYTTKEE